MTATRRSAPIVPLMTFLISKPSRYVLDGQLPGCEAVR